MGFDRRDIRPAMDVYTLDNVYLGVVRAVVPGPLGPGGVRVPEATPAASAVDGELRGPVPTQDIGNAGPRTQSARAGYAAAPDGAEPLGDGALEVGKWWGLVGRRTIPLRAVQTVSLERVTLRQTKDELPRAW
jgi:hypothetical protein